MSENIICPYCGHEFVDSWELYPNDTDLGLIFCDECEKEFYASRDIEVTYNSQPAEYGKCKICSSENVVIENFTSNFGAYKELCVECGEKQKRKLWNEHIKCFK